MIGITYVMLSLIIGECHPFSLVSMYNSFPAKSTVFYVADKEGNALPLTNYFNYNTNDFNHTVLAILDKEKVDLQSAGNAQYNAAGLQMMAALVQRKKANLAIDSLQIHKVQYSLQGDSIKRNDELIYVGAAN